MRRPKLFIFRVIGEKPRARRERLPKLVGGVFPGECHLAGAGHRVQGGVTFKIQGVRNSMVTGWLMDGEEELRAGLSVGFNSMCWGLAQWPFLPAQKRISLCDSQGPGPALRKGPQDASRWPETQQFCGE